MNYPKYRTDKNIVIRMAPQIGVMGCEYRHLTKAFGHPNLSTEYGDEFDGVEKCAWHIEFETGVTAKISDVRPFGSNDLDYKAVKQWRVNSRDENAYEWIKERIRDANPTE